VTSNQLLSSLGATLGGCHGLDLSLIASYSVQQSEDEDVARFNHRINLKGGGDGVYSPVNGFTTPVPRFKNVKATLMQLTDFMLPPLRVVRPTQVMQVFYGFGDASGKQFGATLSKNYNCRGHLSETRTINSGIRFRIGLWSPMEEEESSNYKELKNLVDTIGEEAKEGKLGDCELFIFTNNSTAEGCFYRGNLKSVCLHALVLDLWTLKMTYGMAIHVIHISGGARHRWVFVGITNRGSHVRSGYAHVC
jgi:hypothetical protein